MDDDGETMSHKSHKKHICVNEKDHQHKNGGLFI